MTDQPAPDPAANLQLSTDRVLRAGDPIVTYVARNLEPYRGFHSFMRALPHVLKEHPTCQVVIVGGDGVSYGSKPKDAPNWRTKMLRENPVDQERVHFLGKVPYDTYRKVLQVSAVHVYLTYPFVLSWSMLEAMASGCLVLGSNTAPVQEMIRHGGNGVLMDMFNIEKIGWNICEYLNEVEIKSSLRKESQLTVKKYSINSGRKVYMREIYSEKSASLSE